jgi:hypothetical protein
MRVCDDGEMTETRSYPSATKSSIDRSVARHSSTLVAAAGGVTGAVCDQPRLESDNTVPATRMSTAPERIGEEAII